jgi:hypothetical protein
MKYIKIFLTNFIVGGTWWQRHIWIPSVVDHGIRVVINGYALSMPPEKDFIIVGGGTLPPPIHHMTSVHRDMARSCGPCGIISTIGLKSRTHSNKKLHKMDANQKFIFLPCLQSVT